MKSITLQHEAPTVRGDRDFLGFKPISKAIARRILDCQAPMSFAVTGSWGSGKTSMLRLIEEELRSNGDVQSVFFDAWKFRNTPSLLYALLYTIYDDFKVSKNEFSKSGIGQKVLGLGLGVAASVAKNALKVDVDEVAKKIESLSQNISSAFDEEIKQAATLHTDVERSICNLLAKEGKKRLVVFVDDLDRCPVLDALSLLEEMTIHFSLKQTVIVYGISLEAIQVGIEKKYGLDKRHVQGYLDKLVQFEYEIKPVTGTEQLVDEYLKAALGASNLEEIEAVDRLCGQCVGEAMRAQSVSNPRLLKKVIGKLLVATSMEGFDRGNEMDIKILADLMVCKAALPTFYRMITDRPRLLIDLTNFVGKGKQDRAGAAISSDLGGLEAAEATGVLQGFISHLIKGGKIGVYQPDGEAKLRKLASLA